MYTKQILGAPTRSAKERKKQTLMLAVSCSIYIHTYVYKQQTLAYNYFFPGLVFFCVCCFLMSAHKKLKYIAHANGSPNLILIDSWQC